MDSSDTDDDLQVAVLSDFSDDEEESNKSMSHSVEYELLSTNDLIHEMNSSIVKVSTVLLVNEAIAKCFLTKFEWNVELLVNNYYDCSDLNSFLLSLNIPNTKLDIPSPTVQPTTQCEICLISLVETTVTDLHCGHRFCENCCGQYFEEKVLNVGEGNTIECPDPSCKTLIDDATVIKLIPERAKQQLLSLITRAFVASNPLLRYCRSEGCEYTIKANTPEPIPVICKCGFESCLQCGEIWHGAITCVLLRKWVRVCVDSTEWQNGRCPTCSYTIRKNVGWNGFNHVQCEACNYYFCCQCVSDWCQYGTCSKSDWSKAYAKMRRKRYDELYINHIRSLRFERGIYNSIVQKMMFFTSEEIVDTTTPDIVLKRALEILRRSRQALISSYALACYSEDCDQLNIFESNQNDLERATENLSELLLQLEQGITKQRWIDEKQKLEEKCVYCDKRWRALLDHINEGCEKGYWNLKVY